MTTPSEDYRLIPLTQGQFAKVSPARFEWLSQWKWCARWDKTSHSFYAIRGAYLNGKCVTVLMHREVLGLEKGDKRHGDHINHDTLDNQDSNLRIANSCQSAANKKREVRNKSGVRGVYLHKNGRYSVGIKTKGKRYHIGMYDDLEEARNAYNTAAQSFFGEFANRS
jgi:hypothetical protein